MHKNSTFHARKPLESRITSESWKTWSTWCSLYIKKREQNQNESFKITSFLKMQIGYNIMLDENKLKLADIIFFNQGYNSFGHLEPFLRTIILKLK